MCKNQGCINSKEGGGNNAGDVPLQKATHLRYLCDMAFLRGMSGTSLGRRGGGNGKGGGVTGFHTPVRGTMFVHNGAVTPGPSRECDITFFVQGRPKSLHDSRVTGQWRRAQGAERRRTVILGDTRMSVSSKRCFRKRRRQ